MSNLTKISNCWICGEPANSKEHKFKASLIRSNYGKKFEKGKEIEFWKGNNFKLLNSYKDSNLKFSKSICQQCNNVLTKPHDNSYDKFINYFDENQMIFFEKEYIDFSVFYGKHWIEQKKNFYRYMAKHAGCKIIEHKDKYNIDVTDLSEFIKGAEKLTNFKIHFQVKPAMKFIVDYVGKGLKNIYNSPTAVFNDSNQKKCFGGWHSYQWLSIVWVYCEELKEENQTNFRKKDESIEYIDFDENLINSNMKTSQAMDAIELYGCKTAMETELRFRKIIENTIK